ncbi:LysR family transcriptional regulator [Parasphingorhabdus sp.]|uniref:LysR family transcriptional regulator n=1 Tax=Parasphingorhabdus sp. TaxID=2709688 RepID=UPI0032675A1C
MENWDDYRLIIALSRAGTMRRAAETLGLTHTTVSRRLAILEKSRGQIFEKNTRGYRTTDLGDAMLSVAERIEHLTFAGTRYQNANEASVSGPVRLSVPEAVAQYMLLDDLFRFSKLYPEINLTVETSYSFANLDKSEADVVVRGAQEPSDHLVGRRLFANHVTYYADRNYLDRTPANELRWIAPASDGLWPSWIENSPFPNVPVAMVIDDITARHRALVKGYGLGRGACFMADPESNLVRLSTEPPVPQQDFWVLTHPDLRDTPRIKLLMDFIVAAILQKRQLIYGQL